jgi:ribonuclease BN (tRNA processing enzyme)
MGGRCTPGPNEETRVAASVQVVFLGTGDAFGSGGRMQTCVLLRAEDRSALIDCGATGLIAMHRRGVDPNTIDLVLLSHLHGDHMAGLPFLILDAQLISRRTTPLTIAGPAGTQSRLEHMMEVMFPGSSTVERRFPLKVVEMEPGRRQAFEGFAATPYLVNHPSGAPAHALRIECGGKIIAYSGDTDWTDTLIVAARDADLFIVEAYTCDKPVKYHLDYQTLSAHLHELRPKRWIVTHMGAEMLSKVAALGCEYAEDGQQIEV